MKQKLPKYRKRFLLLWFSTIAILLGAILLTLILSPPGKPTESIKEVMKDAVLHEHHMVSFFGLSVNPAVLSAYIVTTILLSAAALIRIFAFPRFRYTPGKCQSAIEVLVEFFSGIARSNSPGKCRFLEAYVFSAGVYIAFSTLFELLGVQVITTSGVIRSLPAPLSDINAAIAMGFTSFGVILVAGIATGGLRGALRVLRDFSLPISMSFRLFGALLSGLLITELVYYYISLSFVLPAIVGILFTLLHALIQAYVLVTLVAVFYGEAVCVNSETIHSTTEHQEVP